MYLYEIYIQILHCESVTSKLINSSHAAHWAIAAAQQQSSAPSRIFLYTKLNASENINLQVIQNILKSVKSKDGSFNCTRLRRFVVQF
jgi:hypothetical protein